MKKTNLVLIIIIVLVLGALAFFGSKAWQAREIPKTDTPVASAPVKKFQPIVIENKGKESEERDAVLEADVRKIDSAVKEYAKDNKGRYPMSYFKDPCQAVRYCLKGVNINFREKPYLNPIPQVKPGNLDYHYTADNE